MPETFEQAQEEEAEEKEHEGVRKERGSIAGGESPITFQGERLENVADRFEDWVTATPDQLRERLVQRQQRIEERGQNIEVDISGQQGFNLNQLLNQIQGTSLGLQNLQDILQFTDLPDTVVVNDLGVEDLLQLQLRTLVNFIAPNIASSAELLKIISSAQAQQLSALLTIVDEVSPASQFVVTGRNVLDNTDTPEPVIPDADNTNIPTRRLFIRADPNNQDLVAFGDDDVSPDTGFFLNAGGSIRLKQNFADEVLYMAGTQGDAVRLLGFL